VNSRLIRWLLGDPITARKAARTIIVGTIFVTIASGFLIQLFDKKDYPTLGSGMWWAVQTVTTVGYGDNVPTSAYGRIVASLLMVVGITMLAVLTATVTAALVESARVRRRLGETDVEGDKLDAISARLDRIESRLSER
jgi:voltage-gated potassium channel Kch